MNSRFLTTRRRILQQLAMTLSTAAVTLPTHAAPHPACVTGDPDLSAAIDGLISQRNSAAIIGEAYLAQFDSEAQRLDAFVEFFAQDEQPIVLDFWDWDQQHNPQRLDEESITL